MKSLVYGPTEWNTCLTRNDTQMMPWCQLSPKTPWLKCWSNRTRGPHKLECATFPPRRSTTKDFIEWGQRGREGATRALCHAKCGQATRCTKCQGIWVVVSQHLSEAVGTRHKRVRTALLEWATATIHLTSYVEIAKVYTEQVQSQVVARTQGALPKETFTKWRCS